MPTKMLMTEAMKSVTAKTRAYFKNEFGIDTTKSRSCGGKLDSIVLLDMTVVVVVGGAINLLVVFSFQDSLINFIYHKMTDELGIKDDEIETFREAAAGDVINNVIGHSMVDLQRFDEKTVSMTPPTILNSTNMIKNMGEYTVFYAQNLDTILGSMTISFVGSRELFIALLG